MRLNWVKKLYECYIMYQFIQVLHHRNPQISHVGYLYQDITTNKYYLSYTHFNSEDLIDNSNQFMLLNNKPKISAKSLLKNIDIVSEVTYLEYKLNNIKDYCIFGRW